MLGTAIVIFREILEISLILSVVLAATRGLPGRGLWIWLGIAGGVGGASLVAIFASAIANAAQGVGQEFFNAGVLLAATLVIGWTVLWMAKHARELTQHLRQVSADIKDGNMPFYSLAIVIALAIWREGAEIVLFINGMMASGQDTSSIVMGSTIGFVGGAGMGVGLYFGLITLSPKHVFGTTKWLLVLVSAGMAATAAKFLTAAGWFETLSQPLWDSSSILSNGSIAGKTLHALLGYTAQPSAIELIFYAITLGSLAFLMQKTKPKPKAA